MIETLETDVAILALNPTRYGDFAQLALPPARRNNTGVLAMKVMRDITDKGAAPRELLQYAWTLPGVAAALVGHYGMEVLEENVRWAKEFASVDKVTIDRKDLEKKLAHLAGPKHLCWARPDYFDGKIC